MRLYSLAQHSLAQHSLAIHTAPLYFSTRASWPHFFGLEGRPCIARGEPRFAAEPRECGRRQIRGRAQDIATHRRSPSPQQPERIPGAASKLALLAWPGPGLCTVARSAGCAISETTSLEG